MTFNWRSYIDALSAVFNERIARHRVCHRTAKMSARGGDPRLLSDELTSQHLTRSRKRRTSDCFFFCSSSTYLSAPICVDTACQRSHRQGITHAQEIKRHMEAFAYTLDPSGLRDGYRTVCAQGRPSKSCQINVRVVYFTELGASTLAIIR